MAIPTNGLVLYLPLYSPGLQGSPITSKDANRFSCTVTGATWGNKGRTFNGTSNYITVPDHATLDVTTELTILTWVYYQGAGTGNGIICYRETGATPPVGTYAFLIQTGAGGNQHKYSLGARFSGGAWGDSIANSVVPQNVWTNLAVVFDGPNDLIRFYINAVADGTIAQTGNLADVTGDLSIGRENSQAAEYLNAKIGEVELYNRVLSPAEITGVYNDTKGIYAAAVASVFIDEVRAKVRNSQLMIDDRIGERSVANFTVVDSTGSSSFVRGQPIAIFDDDRTTPSSTRLVFNGFIDTPEATVLSPSGALLHDISCIDNHYLADKRIAAKVWENKTSASMVSELITDYLSSEGITAGTIQTGDTLTRVVANYVPVSDVIDALAGANGFVWFINADRQLNFMDRTTNTASFSLTASRVLDSPSPRLSKANQQYRNIQWIRGGVDTTSQTENFLGDAKQQAFVVGFPIQTSPAITENGASKTIGIRGLDTGKDYYWNKGDPVVYANAAPSSNASVQVVYTGEYKTIVMARNDNAVASQATVEGIGTGRVEHTIVNTDLDTRVEAQEFGEAALTRWCQNAEKFQFTTRTAGLQAGQMLNVTFAPFDFTTHDMLVEAVNVKANDVELNYNVTAITGPMLGSWARLFKSFGEGREVRLGEDEQVILMRIQNETLAFAETATALTDSISSGIVARWLNKPPIDSGSAVHIQHEFFAFAEIQVPAEANTASYTWN